MPAGAIVAAIPATSSTSQSSQSAQNKKIPLVTINDDKSNGDQPRRRLRQSVDFHEGDDFDVVESEPDELTSSSSDENDNDDKKLSKKKKRKNLLKEEERVRRRLQELSKVKIGFREFATVLDWYMLKLMGKGLLGFAAVGAILSLIYLIGVFFMSDDLWYEYFPPSDTGNNLNLHKLVNH